MSATLSKYFTGVGAKRLTDVEIKKDVSNQHEFNGISEFKEIFGSDKMKFFGKFLYLLDEESKTIEQDGSLTWYDARESHISRTEYRLYYSTNEVIENASVGDLIIIARTGKENLLVVVTPMGSTSEKQLLWLFGLAEVENKFIIKDLSGEKKELGYAGEYILNSLGIEIEEEAADYLGEILGLFGESFPSTLIFSEYARSTIKDVSPNEEPDKTLVTWMEREELLFKTLEKHLVQKKLNKGFGNDVEDFINFSLSVQNRRKSRAGRAFENHLASVFDSCKLIYSKKGKTERNNEPDFLFPGITQYKDPNFSNELLTMLGLKTTAKDRWRQVLSEADRIWPKHLITLEPAISKNQTDEMKSQKLQLVLPKEIAKTYTMEQQKEIMTLSDFISLVFTKQSK